MGELLETIGGASPAHQTAADGCEPQIVLLILSDRPNRVTGQRTGYATLAAVHPNAVAIVPIQPALGGEPDILLGVLQNPLHGALGKSVTHRQVIKVHRSHCGYGCRGLDGAARCGNQGAPNHDRADEPRGSMRVLALFFGQGGHAPHSALLWSLCDGHSDSDTPDRPHDATRVAL